MNAKRPHPLYANQADARPKCPVCGHASYSKSGVHPQCSQRQADEQRMDRVKARKKVEAEKAKTAPSTGNRPWHKTCPKCRAEVHIRRTDCECGYRFVSRAPD